MRPPYRFNIQLKHPPRSEMAGDWAGHDKGTGYEFWGLRKYLPGDSWSRIDWKRGPGAASFTCANSSRTAPITCC